MTRRQKSGTVLAVICAGVYRGNASRVYPITHPYIENTIPSMRAAIDAGAAAIELDGHRTSDRALAVFHGHAR